MLPHHADLRHIQAILGHTSLRSMQIYTHVNIEILKQADGRGETMTPCRSVVVLKWGENAMHERVSVHPDVCSGRACIKGKRIPVSLIVKMLANGDTIEEILEDYPTISREDILACLAYAGELAEEENMTAEPLRE